MQARHQSQQDNARKKDNTKMREAHGDVNHVEIFMPMLLRPIANVA